MCWFLCVLGKMLLSTSPLNYQWIIFEPVGIMWVICNKAFKDKRALCYNYEMNTEHKTNSWRKIHSSRSSSQETGAFVHLRGRGVKLVRTYTAVASKQCWTNVTGTTTGTINTAVVPLTMSLSWHSVPVWWYWKRKWILSQLWKTRSTGESSPDLTGSSTGQGSTLCFKVVSQWSCCF